MLRANALESPELSRTRTIARTTVALRAIDDLIEMLAAPSILNDRCRSVARTRGLRWMLKIYERAPVIACPILLVLTRHCGIWPNDMRRQQPDMHAGFLTSGLASPTNMLRFGILIAASVLASSVASAGSRPLR